MNDKQLQAYQSFLHQQQTQQQQQLQQQRQLLEQHQLQQQQHQQHIEQQLKNHIKRIKSSNDEQLNNTSPKPACAQTQQNQLPQLVNSVSNNTTGLGNYRKKIFYFTLLLKGWFLDHFEFFVHKLISEHKKNYF